MGYFLWLSDLHLDLWYGSPDLAANHKAGDACGLPDNATISQHPYGRVGCDAPLSLLESTLSHAQKSLENMKSSSNTNSNNDDNLFDFVLVTGDFSRHAMARLNDTQLELEPMQEAQRTIKTCDDALLKNLGNVPIIPVLGNNDVVPDYYLDTMTNHRHGNETNSSSPHSNNLMLDMVTNSLPNTLSDVDDRESYRNYGYFAKTIGIGDDDKAILVVSLNTVLYSQFHEPNHGTNSNGGDDDVLDEDPLGQFSWLESILAKATADTPTQTIVGIYLCGHIPPSIGSYRHTQLWHEQYLQRYYGILESYYHSAATTPKPFVAPPILGHLFGHVHTEEFRLLDLATPSLDTTTNTIKPSNNNAEQSSLPSFQIPLIVTSSVTPIYGSNPSYKIVEFDDSGGKLLDYTTTYLDLAKTDERIPNGTALAEPVWVTLPSFVQDYNVSDLSATSFQTLFHRLEKELNKTVVIQCNQTASGSNNTTNITITTNSNIPNNDDKPLLWTTFLDRRDLYSVVPDNGDDGTSRGIHTMIDWLCTLRSSRRNAYKDCLASKGHEYYYSIGGDESDNNATMTLICNPDEIPLPPPSGIAVLYLMAANVIGIASVLGCFWFVYMTRNGLLRRRKYHKTAALDIMDEQAAVHGTIDERANGHNEEDHTRSTERTVV